MARHKLGNTEELPITNQESPVKQHRLTTTVRIYNDTAILINDAMKRGDIRDRNGIIAKRVADVMEIAISNYLRIRLISDFDKRLMADYGFTNPDQLDLYNQALSLIPKELRTIDLRRTLRQVIIDGKVTEFLHSIGVANYNPAPEGF